jgi:hypothetical protein
MMKTIKRLPVSTAERALILPIFFAGCLASETGEQQFFLQRLALQTQLLGNVPQALKTMGGVWDRRALHGGGIDWRRVASELGFSPLLI